MNRIVIAMVSVMALVISINPGQAEAEITLISAALPGGAGGVTCACTNLKASPLDITIKITTTTIGDPLSVASNFTIQPGYTAKYTSTGWAGLVSSGNCNIIRQDRVQVRAKDLSCTFSAIDAGGYPIVTIPVDKNFKIPKK